MINFNSYIVFDTETTGIGPGKQMVEIAACIIDARKLKIKDQGIFSSLCSVIPNDKVEQYGLDPIEDKALEVNGLTMDQVMAAPPLKKVWTDFENWISYHNPSGSEWKNPIPVAHNLDFDLDLVNNIKYGLHRKKNILKEKPISQTKKKKMTNDDLAEICRKEECLKEPWGFSNKSIFHPRDKIDNLQTVFQFFESNKEPHKLNQVAIREFLGLEADQAHGALIDTLYTAEIFVRFLKIIRQVTQEIDYDTKGITHLPIREIMESIDRI